MNKINEKFLLSKDPKAKRLLNALRSCGFNLEIGTVRAAPDEQLVHCIYEFLVENEKKHFDEYLEQLKVKISDLLSLKKAYDISWIKKSTALRGNEDKQSKHHFLFYLGTGLGGSIAMAYPFIHIVGYNTLNLTSFLVVSFSLYGFLLAPLIGAAIGALTLGLALYLMSIFFAPLDEIPDLTSEHDPVHELENANQLSECLIELQKAKNEYSPIDAEEESEQRYSLVY
jgi:hypothetical protein